MTLEASFTILKVSFTLIYNVFSTGVTYDNHHMMIVIYSQYRPLVSMTEIKKITYLVA